MKVCELNGLWVLVDGSTVFDVLDFEGESSKVKSKYLGEIIGEDTQKKDNLYENEDGSFIKESNGDFEYFEDREDVDSYLSLQRQEHGHEKAYEVFSDRYKPDEIEFSHSFQGYYNDKGEFAWSELQDKLGRHPMDIETIDFLEKYVDVDKLKQDLFREEYLGIQTAQGLAVFKKFIGGVL